MGDPPNVVRLSERLRVSLPFPFLLVRFLKMCNNNKKMCLVALTCCVASRRYHLIIP